RKLQAKTEAYASHQRYHVKSRGMKRKQHQKELEEVPAYVRRRLEMEQQREREQIQKIAQEKQQEKEEQQEVTPSTTINLEAIEHTKPEELDEVFRKRDGIRKQTEVEDSEAIIPDKTPSSPSAPTNAFFDIVEKESQDASSGEDAISSVDVEAATTNEPETMATENTHEDVNESNSIINEDQGPIEHMQASTINTEQVAPLSTEKKDIPNYLLNDPITANEDDSDWLIEQQILLEDT